jgi:hypothetical protein
MAAAGSGRHNRRMMKQQTDTNTAADSRRKSTSISELRALIDQRDETIRLLNEALSRALDELTELDRAA